MTDLEELIQAADRLCESLSTSAHNEIAFSEEICQELEVMSWQSFKISNDLKLIKLQVAI